MTSEIPDKLTQLLTGNDENLVYGVWELINDQYEWYMEDHLPELGNPLRVIGDIQEADFHIGEVGMYYLLIGETADLTSIPGSFDAVGAFEVAELIRKTYSTVPEELIQKRFQRVRQEAIPEPDIKDPIGAGGGVDVCISFAVSRFAYRITGKVHPRQSRGICAIVAKTRGPVMIGVVAWSRGGAQSGREQESLAAKLNLPM